MKKMMTCFFISAMISSSLVWAGPSGGAGAGVDTMCSIKVGRTCQDFYGQRHSGEVRKACYGAQVQQYQKKYGNGRGWHDFLAPCKLSKNNASDVKGTVDVTIKEKVKVSK